MSLVLLENGPAEGVRVLTLNDPDKRNALSPALQAALGDALDAVAARCRTRGCSWSPGTGTAFSAGADLPALFGQQDREVAEIRAGLQGDLQTASCGCGRLEIPTIAAVNGAAVGRRGQPGDVAATCGSPGRTRSSG